MGDIIENKFEYASEIAKLIKKSTGVDVFENSRKQEIIEYRSLLIYVLREIEKMTLFSIRDFFKQNGKSYDHSTVHHSWKNFEMYSNYNSNLLDYYNLLIKDSNTPNSRKFLAKSIIDKSESSLADTIIYMYNKSQNEN